jgi:DUF917 family protein
MLTKLGGQVVANVPDLIVILDYETSTPINAERLRYGQHIAEFVVGLPTALPNPKGTESPWATLF